MTILKNTPWGKPDHVERIQEGVAFYHTPSHGGYHVSADRIGEIPQDWQDFAAKWSHGAGPHWFEEDCAAAGPAMAFEERTPERTAWATSVANSCGLSRFWEAETR